MQACKYNVGEFKPFTSGKKRIKPAVSDDWEVFTGGFAKSTDVLNLRSPKLDQIIYDIGTKKFFDFMRNENVTMNGNKIVGRFVIGSQRVLRKESDYNETMATITERKSNAIPKSEFKVGYRYETVCGSTFVYAGFRYIIKENTSSKGIKATNIKKTYLSYGVSDYWNKSGIADITSKKVVKELGKVHDKKFLDDKISLYANIDGANIIYCSEDKTKPKLRIEWEPYKCDYAPEFAIDKDGFVYKKDISTYRSEYRYVLIDGDEDNLNFNTSFTKEYFTGYYAKRNTISPVRPKWVIE